MKSDQYFKEFGIVTSDRISIFPLKRRHKKGHKPLSKTWTQIRGDCDITKFHCQFFSLAKSLPIRAKRTGEGALLPICDCAGASLLLSPLPHKPALLLKYEKK